MSILQVQWVTREDDGVSTNLPLDDVGGLAANNLPEEVTGDVDGLGHYVMVFWPANELESERRKRERFWIDNHSPKNREGDKQGLLVEWIRLFHYS